MRKKIIIALSLLIIFSLTACQSEAKTTLTTNNYSEYLTIVGRVSGAGGGYNLYINPRLYVDVESKDESLSFNIKTLSVKVGYILNQYDGTTPYFGGNNTIITKTITIKVDSSGNGSELIESTYNQYLKQSYKAQVSYIEVVDISGYVTIPETLNDDS